MLDDYSPLRAIAGGLDEAVLFPVRDPWWYVERVPLQARGKPSQGSTDFDAPNPPYGALITYYLNDPPQTAKEARREAERALADDDKDIPFPGWEGLREESLEDDPRVVLLVRDAAGEPVRRLIGPAKAGLHRLNWDLRRQAPDPVDLDPPGFRPPWAGERQGPFAGPGGYTVELALLHRGSLRSLGEEQSFEVKAIPASPTSSSAFRSIANYQRETADFMRRVNGAGEELARAGESVKLIEATALETAGLAPEVFAQIASVRATLADLRLRLWGDRIRGRWDEASLPSISRRVGQVAGGHWDTRQKPTLTQRRSLEIAREQFAALSTDLEELTQTTLPALRAALEAAGAAWTP